MQYHGKCWAAKRSAYVAGGKFDGEVTRTRRNQPPAHYGTRHRQIRAVKASWHQDGSWPLLGADEDITEANAEDGDGSPKKKATPRKTPAKKGAAAKKSEEPTSDEAADVKKEGESDEGKTPAAEGESKEKEDVKMEGSEE